MDKLLWVLIAGVAAIIFALLVRRAVATRARRAALPRRGSEGIRANLEEALRSERTCSAVIFEDMSGEHFLQFCPEQGKLLLDIPTEEFSDEHKEVLEQLAGPGAFAKTEEGTYQLRMLDVESAVTAADAIFRNIFGAVADYELRIKFV